MNKSLPFYKLKIKTSEEHDTQVDFIALVDKPAIEIDWQKFSQQHKFAADAERRLVMSPFMVADMPIYRRDETRGEFYVMFDKETIYEIVQKFFKKGFVNNFNAMHNDPAFLAKHKLPEKLDGVYLIESFIVDSSRGVAAPKAFEGISEGSWLGTVKIDNDVIWNDFVKTNTLKAFSIEGMFEYEQIGNEEEKVLKEIVDIVKGGN